MHFLAILLGILSFAAVWYWRIKALQEVAKDGRKIAETVGNLPRKMRFKNKTGKVGLSAVDDPLVAALLRGLLHGGIEQDVDAVHRRDGEDLGALGRGGGQDGRAERRRGIADGHDLRHHGVAERVAIVGA